MPYYKKRVYAKKPQKDTWEKKGERVGGAIGSIASKVKSIVRELNVEHKDEYVSYATVIPVAGIIEDLSNVAVGTASNQRVGNQIKILNFASRSIYNEAGLDITNNGNVYIRQYTSNGLKDAVAPVILDILRTANPMSHLQTDTEAYYQIYSDKIIHFDNATANGKFQTFYKSFTKQPLRIRWNEDNTTIKTKFYRLLITDTGNGVNRATYDKLTYVDN